MMKKIRSSLVIIDTALAAATSILVLLMAAKYLDSPSLSLFSLAQLLIVTGVGLQRAFVLSPGLASQRKSGQIFISIRLCWIISVPAAVGIGLVIGMTVQPQSSSQLQWMALSMMSTLVALSQDVVRFSLFSRDRLAWAAISDGVWFLFMLLGLILIQPSTVFEMFLYWAFGGAIALAVGLYGVFSAPRTGTMSSLKIRDAWRLGKWSGLDNSMSAAANLLPMFVSSLALGSDAAGVYRVLQGSLGPLNVLTTSIVTLFGLESWRLVGRTNLNLLRKKVSRLFVVMVLFSLFYIVVAQLLIIRITGIESNDLLRICIIVAIVGVLGAATTPFSSAALALGYQKYGVLIRCFVIFFAFIVTFFAIAGIWLPWNDPIGTVSLFAAVVGLGGWAMSYSIALRKELAVATDVDQVVIGARK